MRFSFMHRLQMNFAPFVHEENVTYSVSAPKRDLAFRKVVVANYEHHCSFVV